MSTARLVGPPGMLVSYRSGCLKFDPEGLTVEIPLEAAQTIMERSGGAYRLKVSDPEPEPAPTDILVTIPETEPRPATKKRARR